MARDRIALLVIWSLIVSGCASVSPAPTRPIVTLTTTRATTYYSLRETTTKRIFEEISAHRLIEQDGQHAVGLALARSKMTWKARAMDAWCTPESVTITLDLVVTLPRHERPDDLHFLHDQFRRGRVKTAYGR